MKPPSEPPRRLLVTAAAVIDHRGPLAGPGAVLFEVPASEFAAVRVLAAGEVKWVFDHPAAQGAERKDQPGDVILPGLVNAHAHLDLTAVGPRPHDPARGFIPWIDMVRRERASGSSPEAIRAAVLKGAALSRAGGTVAIGDIAGAVNGRPSDLATRALHECSLAGLSATEFFGLGPAVDRLEPLLREALAGSAPGNGPLAQTLSPHAPYSVGPAGYALAGRLSSQLPIVTHLAETIEEREFIARGTGPLREMLFGIAVLTGEVARGAGFGAGRSPVAHTVPHLPQGATVVHVNDADDADLALLRERGCRVVYCPRASAYFDAPRHFGPHRYQEMLRAGIPVALGTDSIINLPASCADPNIGISVLDEMRLLARRDGVDPLALLTMATVNGALTLGIAPEAFTFPRDGASCVMHGLIALRVGDERRDPLAAALDGESRPRPLTSVAP